MNSKGRGLRRTLSLPCISLSLFPSTPPAPPLCDRRQKYHQGSADQKLSTQPHFTLGRLQPFSCVQISNKTHLYCRKTRLQGDNEESRLFLSRLLQVKAIRPTDTTLHACERIGHLLCNTHRHIPVLREGGKEGEDVDLLQFGQFKVYLFYLEPVVFVLRSSDVFVVFARKDGRRVSVVLHLYQGLEDGDLP